MKVGQSSLQSAQFFVNAAYLLMKILKYMLLVALVIERVKLQDFIRPNQSRAYTGLYPNGFYQIHSTINDVSAAAGLRGKIFKSWNFDLSNR
jgi:iron complex outermembrane receptor protein